MHTELLHLPVIHARYMAQPAIVGTMLFINDERKVGCLSAYLAVADTLDEWEQS